MKSTLLSSFAALGLVLITTSAFADSLSDCGDIDVEANAKCEVMAEGGCAVDQCTPLNCSASLYAECKGQCKATLPSCEVDCKGSCSAKCDADANFDCSADCSVRCNGSCKGDCEAECSSSKDSQCQAKCKGTCEASCKSECSANCKVEASATCDAKCKGSCSATCNTKANLSCQVDCSAKGEASCTGGCEIACSKPNAALICDGQYSITVGTWTPASARLKPLSKRMSTLTQKRTEVLLATTVLVKPKGLLPRAPVVPWPRCRMRRAFLDWVCSAQSRRGSFCDVAHVVTKTVV